MPAISPYLVSSTSSNTDGTTYAPAAMALTTGRYAIAWILTRMASGGGPNQPTLTDTLGNTWVAVLSQLVTVAGGDLRLTALTSRITSGGSSTLTYDFAAQTQTTFEQQVDEWTNVDITTPIITANNVTVNGTASATTTAVTLPNAKGADFNVCVMGMGFLSNAIPTLQAAAGGGLLNSGLNSSEALGLRAAFAPEVKTLTFTHGNVAGRTALGFELKQDGTSLGGGTILSRIRTGM